MFQNLPPLCSRIGPPPSLCKCCFRFGIASLNNWEAIVQRPLQTLYPQTPCSSVLVLKQWLSSVVLSFQRFDVELKAFLDEVQEGNSSCYVANPCLVISGVQNQELHCWCCRLLATLLEDSSLPPPLELVFCIHSKVRIKEIPFKWGDHVKQYTLTIDFMILWNRSWNRFVHCSITRE